MAEKSFKERFLQVDVMIVAVAVLLFSAAMYYFMQDDGLTEANPNSQAQAVGKVALTKNNVRRRTQSGFVWSSVNRNDTVFEGDSIFTDDSSDASISLQDGGHVQIEPKSMVVIRTQSKKTQIDLQYGSLSGKVSADKPIVISHNGVTEELSGHDAEIRIESVGPMRETKIRVVKGEVKIKKVDTSGKANVKPAVEQTVKENEIAQVKSVDEEPVVIHDIAELVAPANGKSLWLALGQGVQFKWSVVGKKGANRLELATDSNFTNPIFSTDVTATSFTVPNEKIPNGQVHWRVTPLASGTHSTPFRATFYPDIPPLPTFPADGQEFAFEPLKGEKGKQITLTWDDKSGSSSYELQLAHDQEFHQQIVSKPLTTTSETTPLLGKGTYFWRVRGQNVDRVSPPWSSVMRFSVDEEAREPDAPVLARNIIAYEVPAAVLDRAPPNAGPDGAGVSPENLPPFTWSPAKNAETYEVEIASTDTFANSIKIPVGTEMRFAPQEVKPGSTYVRVRGKGKKGLVSPPSQTGRLEITLEAPKLDPIPAQKQVFNTKDDLEKGKHAFQLSWTPRPFASTYEVNWGADGNFEQSKKFRLKGNKREITVTQPGDYSARVRAIGTNGAPLGPYSNVQVASYRKELAPPPVLAAVPPPGPPAGSAAAKPKPAARQPSNVSKEVSVPVLMDPKPASSFVSLDDSTSFVNLRWQGVKNAKSYEIEIAEDRDFTQPMKFTTMRSTYTVKRDLPEGKVYWRVRAVDKKKGFSEWSEIFDLNVLYQ